MKRKAFKCNNIYTGKCPETIKGYVITEGNKIIFVGDEETGKKLIDINTELIDVTNNFIMPGFNDFHMHMMDSGLFEADGVLNYIDSEEGVVEFLYNRHRNDKSKKWIIGGGWDKLIWPDKKEPTKASLDKRFPDTPVFLPNKEGHGAWVNSATLRLFGIDKNTPDPEHGKYSRYIDGEPDGYLHEMAATALREKIFASLDEEDVAKYVKAFVKKANKYGVTSFGNVSAGIPLREKAYKLLEDRGELNARVYFYVPFADGVETVLAKQKEYNSSNLVCAGVKTFIDGTPQGYSGYMLDDYSDNPGVRSKPMVEPELLFEQVQEFDKAGIQTRVHACGDAGVRLCLDAIENAIKENGDNRLRHCIEHIEVISPEDIHRFAELGVIASVQPEHMPKYDFYNHPFHSMIGEERMKYSWPFESIRRAGGVLAFGSDSPVVDISPFRGIFRAVTRLTNELEPEGGWNPEERMSIHEALKAYTWGGAYGVGKENELGTIEAGKLADFIVVKENLFECAADRQAMFDMESNITVIDGEVIYEKSNAGGNADEMLAK